MSNKSSSNPKLIGKPRESHQFTILVAILALAVAWAAVFTYSVHADVSTDAVKLRHEARAEERQKEALSCLAARVDAFVTTTATSRHVGEGRHVREMCYQARR